MLVITVLTIILTTIEVKADSCLLIAPDRSRENLTVAEAFEKYEIVGDYLRKAPKDLLMVSYRLDGDCKTGKAISIMPGDVLSAIISFQTPEVTYPKAAQGALYTVMLLGIDIPTREDPSDRAYINGLFVNSPARKLLNGEVVTPYSPGTPLLDTGLHRYVALVYKQKKRIDPNEKELWRLARERTGFTADDFADEYDLEGPVAGNFCLTENNSCGTMAN